MNIQYLSEDLIGPVRLTSIIYFEEIPSTNKYSKLINDGDDILVITDHQTTGSGRLGRQWQSTSGNDIAITLIKKIEISIEEIHLINFYTSYIVYITLKELFNSSEYNFSLKWPNDILIQNKKVCGILSEIQHINDKKKKFIIGIGVNCNTTEFEKELISKATSLKIATGKQINREEIISRLIKNFYKNFEMLNDPAQLISIWKEGSDLMNKEINFKILDNDNEFSAVIINIDNDGGLRLRLNDGSVKVFYSGDITFTKY